MDYTLRNFIDDKENIIVSYSYKLCLQKDGYFEERVIDNQPGSLSIRVSRKVKFHSNLKMIKCSNHEMDLHTRAGSWVVRIRDIILVDCQIYARRGSQSFKMHNDIGLLHATVSDSQYDSI